MIATTQTKQSSGLGWKLAIGALALLAAAAVAAAKLAGDPEVAPAR